MSSPSSAGRGRAPSLKQAAALGALQGPAELLPISSSGHIAVMPWLLGWDYQRSEPEARKGFEVALHAGTAAALLVASGRELVHGTDRRRLTVATAAAVPPVVTGLLLEPMIERRLGTAPSIAAGLIAGSVLMLAADRAAETRGSEDAGAVDGLWLGVAQACALMPGISRSGASLAVARLRGFRPRDAARLSFQVGLPVIAGAAVREALEVRRRRLEPGWAAALAAGAGTAFVSTLISTQVIRPEAARRLSRWAVYRLALAGLIAVSQRSGRDRGSGAHEQGQTRSV